MPMARSPLAQVLRMQARVSLEMSAVGKTVVEDFAAIGAFLIQFKATSTVEAFNATAARQATAIIAKLKSTHLSASEGSLAMQHASDAPWPAVQKQLLCEAIGSVVDALTSHGKLAARTQNLECLQNFLTAGLVRFLQSGHPGITRQKVSVFAEYLVHLGLRAPSERTMQCATGVGST